MHEPDSRVKLNTSVQVHAGLEARRSYCESAPCVYAGVLWLARHVTFISCDIVVQPCKSVINGRQTDPLQQFGQQSDLRVLLKLTW